MCAMPGCNKICWVESNGRVHDYCSKTHAEQHRMMKDSQQQLQKSRHDASKSGNSSHVYPTASGNIHVQCNWGHTCSKGQSAIYSTYLQGTSPTCTQLWSNNLKVTFVCTCYDTTASWSHVFKPPLNPFIYFLHESVSIAWYKNSVENHRDLNEWRQWDGRICDDVITIVQTIV